MNNFHCSFNNSSLRGGRAEKNKLARSITEIWKQTVMVLSDDLCAAGIRKKVNLPSSVYFTITDNKPQEDLRPPITRLLLITQHIIIYLI